MNQNILLLLALLLIYTIHSQGGIQTPGDQPAPVQKPNRTLSFRIQNAPTSYQAIENQVTNSQLNSNPIVSPVSVDTYNLATYVFNLQRYFNYCERCQKLQYMAFRVGRYYLTARNNFLRLEAASSSSPNNNQLFIAEQQVDGTWAFKSLSQNRYIRASNNGVTINYQSFVGAWERWYIQRHGAHVHIQSAQFIYHWWVFDNYVLEQMDGGASSLIVQYWPKLQWLWNW